MSTRDEGCTCSCAGYVDRWGHDPACPKAPRTPLSEILAPLAIFVLFGVLYLGAALGILWIYASWGGSCLESGGRISGSGFDTRCTSAQEKR